MVPTTILVEINLVYTSTTDIPLPTSQTLSTLFRTHTSTRSGTRSQQLDEHKKSKALLGHRDIRGHQAHQFILRHIHMLVDMASSPQYLARSAQSPEHIDIDPRITGMSDASCAGIDPSAVSYSTSDRASYSEVSKKKRHLKSCHLRLLDPHTRLGPLHLPCRDI